MPENYLRHALNSGDFICTAELVLGRDHTLDDIEGFIQDAAADPDGIRVVSLTDLPGGNPAMLPEAFAPRVIDKGITPLVHLTSKDGNRAFLEGRLHALAAAGVENILVLSGDAPNSGFEGKPKPVYDLDSVQLVRLADQMKRGIEYSVGTRTATTTPFDFLIGVAVNPFKISEPALMMQLYKMELKIRAGAQFIITQLGYNIRKLYELKKYMEREGMGDVPVLANIYVPTATIAKFMRSGEVAGCVMPQKLIDILSQEKKSQRLARASLMLAAAKDLGFAGAHIGGFGLKHSDFMKIIEGAEKIGSEWRDRIDELIFEEDKDDFYLFPKSSDGLSDADRDYQIAPKRPRKSFGQFSYSMTNKLVISERSILGRYFRKRMCRLIEKHGLENDAWRRGPTYSLLGLADVFKSMTLGCVQCGDCIQDFMNYSGCSMGKCYKETRNGPCGGSRIDGTCEVNENQQCVWISSYLNTRAAKQDTRKFAETLIPTRNWDLNRTNSLANMFAGIDNSRNRRKIELKSTEE